MHLYADRDTSHRAPEEFVPAGWSVQLHAAPRRPHLALASSLTLCWTVHSVELCNTRTPNSFPTPIVPYQPNTPTSLSSCLHAPLAAIQFKVLLKFTFNSDTVRLSLPVGIDKHIKRTFMSRGVLHLDEQPASKMKLKGSAYEWPRTSNQRLCCLLPLSGTKMQLYCCVSLLCCSFREPGLLIAKEFSPGYSSDRRQRKTGLFWSLFTYDWIIKPLL